MAIVIWAIVKVRAATNGLSRQKSVRKGFSRIGFFLCNLGFYGRFAWRLFFLLDWSATQSP